MNVYKTYTQSAKLCWLNSKIELTTFSTLKLVAWFVFFFFGSMDQRVEHYSHAQMEEKKNLWLFDILWTSMQCGSVLANSSLVFSAFAFVLRIDLNVRKWTQNGPIGFQSFSLMVDLFQAIYIYTHLPPSL